MKLIVKTHICYEFPENDDEDIPIKFITNHVMDSGWLHDAKLGRKISDKKISRLIKKCQEYRSISSVEVIP